MNCQFINPLHTGNGKNKNKQAKEIQSNLYSEISKFISESVGIEMQKALSMSSLPVTNTDVKSLQTLASYSVLCIEYS